MSMGLMHCLYIRVMSSLDWPNFVLFSTRRTSRRIFALVVMFFGVSGESHFLSICHSECSGRVGVSYVCVVGCFCGF